MFFLKKTNIYNKEINPHKSTLKMEKIWSNFDESSRESIKDLVKNNEKLNKLIDKLQTARGVIDNKKPFSESLQKIKK